MTWAQGGGPGQRAVQITVAGSGTGGEAADGRGSGFQLADDLVLTAAHVVVRHGPNPKITVRFHRPDGSGVQVAGTVVFAQEGTVGDLALDVAVLRLDPPVPMSGAAVRFGALTDATDWYSIGYPRFKMRNEDVYEPGSPVPVYRDLERPPVDAIRRARRDK